MGVLMPRGIKSDYEHQAFYRKVLDELEQRHLDGHRDYLNTHYEDPRFNERYVSWRRAQKNYLLVEKRYKIYRQMKGWGH